MKVYVIYWNTPNGDQAMGIAPSIEIACNAILQLYKKTGCDYWYEVTYIQEDGLTRI